jgi:hypothetical protein
MAETHSVVVLPRSALLDRALGALARGLDGKHSWGYLETSAPGRGRWMREQLVLLPPDISPFERRALTMLRHGPVAGACLAMVIMLLIGSVVTPEVAFITAFGLYALAIAASANATRRLRRESIRLVVLTVAVGGNAESYGNVERLSATRAALTAIDERQKSGALSPAEHDLECASLFWKLEAERASLDLELRSDIHSLEQRFF